MAIPRLANRIEPSLPHEPHTPPGREADNEPDLRSQRDIGRHGDHDSQSHADHRADRQKHPEGAALAADAASHHTILRQQHGVVNGVSTKLDIATNASAPASARYERSRDLERGQACSRAGAKLSGIRLTVSYVLLRTYCFARSRPAVTGRRGLASAAPDTMNARILGSELGGEKGGKRKVVRSSCA